MEKEYSAGNIQILKGLEAVRKRPGMYIGSTGIDGLHHLVYEVVDNSIDEALAGFCSKIDIAIEAGNVIRVKDNGRGIPTDIHPEEGISALEVVLTKLHAGGKFDKNSYKVSGGLHGVGISVVNALSEWCEVKVHRNEKIHFQSYKRGVANKRVEVIGETKKTGTIVRFYPDEKIFETLMFSFDTLSNRLRELAFLNKGISINIVDERLDDEKRHNFKFDGGVKSFVSYLNQAKKKLHSEPIYFEAEKDTVVCEIALEYNDSYSENIISFVNNINTREGGTHLSGFKSALTKVFNDFLKKSKFAKKMDENLSGDDCREGLTCVVSVKVQNPQFEGQTKGKLGNSEVKGIVESLVNEKLTLFFEEHPEVINPILEKAINASKARIAARKARERSRKSALSTSSLPGKLADCRSKDASKCEIYIVEGDSAGGSAKQGRDSEFQAILPLWGKMLNVEKARPDKVISNEKLLPIIASLGCGVDKTFDISKLRYDKVIIMADADVDGSHIRTLLLTFMFRYMRPLIEEGHVYIAMPPLYKIAKTKKEIYYAYDDDHKFKILEELGVEEDKIEISRYKGLGEMDPEQLWDTTMDMENRNIIQVKLDDAIEADLMFSTLMGEEVEPRRKFIEENALSVVNLDV